MFKPSAFKSRFFVPCSLPFSTTRNCAKNQRRLSTRCHRVGQWLVWRFERPIFRANKKAQKRAALAGFIFANRSAQHGIARFERIENRPQRGWRLHFEQDIALDV